MTFFFEYRTYYEVLDNFPVCSEYCPKVIRTFPIIFRKISRIAEVFQENTDAMLYEISMF